jgi:hypothetical protein
MNFDLSSDTYPLFLAVIALFWIAVLVVHISFTIAVSIDASKLITEGTGTVFVGLVTWALAVLLGGVFVAAVYWIIHHSELRRVEPVSGNPGPRTLREKEIAFQESDEVDPDRNPDLRDFREEANIPEE